MRIGIGTAIPAIETLLSNKSTRDKLSILDDLGVVVVGSWKTVFENIRIDNPEELRGRLEIAKKEIQEQEEAQKLKNDLLIQAALNKTTDARLERDLVNNTELTELVAQATPEQTPVTRQRVYIDYGSRSPIPKHWRIPVFALAVAGWLLLILIVVVLRRKSR